ncbi:MAG: hypothetical protein ABIS50_11400 [Luteolibacter sp.]|uniref:hypothetical protein n=1 Tax=Luteolibacter sp. TaxID=1962973 RepID=UPI0032642664
MIPVAPIPCKCCGQHALGTSDENGHHLQCSNLIDCDVWPATESLPSVAEAVEAWNKMNAPEAAPTPDPLATIRTLATEALLLNRTIGGKEHDSHPPGFLPPNKRQRVIRLLKQILESAGGNDPFPISNEPKTSFSDHC